MKKTEPMDWHRFSYLNGARRNVDAMGKQLEELLQGFNYLGIAVAGGEVEKAMMKQIAELSKLSAALMKRVQHERKQDITLWLEDI